MRKRIRLSLVTAVGLLIGLPTVLADDAGVMPEAAYEKVISEGDKILFIDVRDPVEIQFTGFVDLVDRNIPFLLVDTSTWNEDGTGFAMPRNEHFLRLVAEALEAKGLDDSATIITMCRSGSARGMPSAAYLREEGYANAMYVINGFEGDSVAEGPRAGERILNGWKNTGLPWGNSMDKEKIYQP